MLKWGNSSNIKFPYLSKWTWIARLQGGGGALLRIGPHFAVLPVFYSSIGFLEDPHGHCRHWPQR